MTTQHVRSALFGLAVGDALGVPVEFLSRASLNANPLTDMIGYGTHNQLPGTFSDDSSLAFCLAETLATGYDLQKIADNFIKWKGSNFWTPRGKVFDMGIATAAAIDRLRAGMKPKLAGGLDESDNGNGSLMRILPLVFYTCNSPIQERFRITKDVSSLTHAHIRSVIACFYYLEFARGILAKKSKLEIYASLQNELSVFIDSIIFNKTEISEFDRLLKFNIGALPENEIHSSGYVMHTLEASIWCLLTTDSYEEAVLKAVNLGHDTDTTAAVTGGLAGLLYGYHAIPSKWIKLLARKNDIDDLCERFARSLS